MATEDAKIELDRNLDHLLISAKGEGPNFTVGDYVLKFQPGMSAAVYGQYIKDIGVENANVYEVMIGFLKQLLVSESDDLDDVLKIIEIEGVAEIVNAVTEVYAGFRKKS